jgi:hypothetical protein
MVRRAFPRDPGHWDLTRFLVLVGATFPRSIFAGTVQYAAILNIELNRYFQSTSRAARECPYAVNAGQERLLTEIGLEVPNPGSPSVPHGFHKNLEEQHLRMLAALVVPNQFELISCKASKQGIFPQPAAVQNPVMEARDMYRYPGSALTVSVFDPAIPVHVMHDVTSVVGPHELVERLVSEHPDGHILATGVNPPEFLVHKRSFHYNSHRIEYEEDSGDAIWYPTGNQSEGYRQPVEVTKSWLQHDSIRGSNGALYQIVLLDYRYGHCLWHVFAGDQAPSRSRQFGTGTFVCVPAILTGTGQAEYLEREFVTNMLDFANRTPIKTPDNFAAKAAGLRAASGGVITAYDCEVGVRIADWARTSRGLAGSATLLVYRLACVATLNLAAAFSSTTTAVRMIDERNNTLVVRTTEGGGWSKPAPTKDYGRSIPNYPTWLERVSACTALAFSLLVPKIVFAEALSHAYRVDNLWDGITRTWQWLGLTWPRSALIASTFVVSQLAPNRFALAIAHWVSHYWRQIWVPGCLLSWYHVVAREVSGAPGYEWFYCGPGRGWAWQGALVLFAAHEVLPGLVGHQFIPFFIGLPLAPMAAAHPAVAIGWLALGAWLTLNYFRHTGRLALPPPAAQPDTLASLAYSFLYAAAALPDRAGNLSATTLPSAVTAAPITPAVVPQPAMRVVQPAYVAPANRAALAISPAGLTFHEWATQVGQAYTANPALFPPLAPNASCFFDVVATVAGGTSHQWYSWFHAMRDTPVANLPVPIGQLTPGEIQRFCATSQFGYAFHGTRAEACPASGGWPVLHMSITVANGLYHVEPLQLPAVSPDTHHLAVVFATMEACDPAWFAESRRRHAFRGGRAPAAAPFLVGVVPQFAGPLSNADVDMAIAASAWTAALTPPGRNARGPGLYRWDFRTHPLRVAVGANGPQPIDYVAPPTYVGARPPAPTVVPQDPVQRMIGPRPPSGAASAARFQFGSIGLAPTLNRPNRAQAGGGPTVRPRARRPRGATPDSALDFFGSSLMVGAAPSPATPTYARASQLAQALAAQLTSFDHTLPARPLAREEVEYTVDLQRAKRLASDFVARPDLFGTNCEQAALIAKTNDAIIDESIRSGKVIKLRATLLLGCAGCGKSTETGRILDELSLEERRQVRVVTHTQRLRAEAKETHKQPGLRGFSFPTIETVTSQPSSGGLIWDDAGKMWGGTIDYVLATNPGVTWIVVNGDPAQGSDYTPLPGGQSEYLPNALESFLPYATKYATISHRIPRLTASLLGLHTTNPAPGHLTFTTQPTGYPVLTASPRYVNVLRGGGEDARTYGSAQGETLTTDVEVDFTGLAGGTTDASVYVALTRSTVGTYLHGSAVEAGSSALVAPTASDILNSILYDMRMRQATTAVPTDLTRRAFAKHLLRAMPVFDMQPVGFSADWRTFSQHVPTAHHVDPVDLAPTDAEPAEGPAADGLVYDAIDPEVAPRDAESRERVFRGMQTRQFVEGRHVNPPRHRATDRATWAAGVAKRIHPGTLETNRARMEACPRDEMCVMFDILQPDVPQWKDHAERYMDTAVLTYAEPRSEQVVLRKLAQHDPDRTGRSVLLSVKEQTIKKLPDVDCNAKAAQMIHMYDIATTLGERAMWRFVEDKIMHNFGPNVTVFNRESPAEFAARVGPRLKGAPTLTGADATSWDAGCDAGMLNFDCHVLARAGLPEPMIRDYRERRLSTFSQLGTMATMQNSGDGGTYCMNSIRDVVVTTIRLRVQPHFLAFVSTPTGKQHLRRPGVAPYGPLDVAREGTAPLLMVNGDDVLLAGDATTSPTSFKVDRFPDSVWEFKDEQGPKLEFSGMYLGTDGSAGYSARGLLHRCLIKAEAGTTDPIQWRAYADLFAGVHSNDADTAEIAKYLLAHLPADVVLDLTPLEFRESVRELATDPAYAPFRALKVTPVRDHHPNIRDK